MTIVREHTETAAEVREALTWMAQTAAGIPDYCKPRRDKAHSKIDALLDQLEVTPC